MCAQISGDIWHPNCTGKARNIFFECSRGEGWSCKNSQKCQSIIIQTLPVSVAQTQTHISVKMKVIMSSIAIAAIALTAPTEALTHKNYVPTSSTSASSGTETTVSSVRPTVGTSGTGYSTTPVTRVVRIPLDSTSSSTSSTTTAVRARKTIPTCKWATLIDANGLPEFGKVGVSCPVYDPFYRTYFYGKPVTAEQHQQNLLEYRQKQFDHYRTVQQKYADYIQSHFRYQQELADMSQQRYLQYFERQQEFQKEALAYQEELRAQQIELQQQRIEEQQKMWEEYQESGFFPSTSVQLSTTVNPFNNYWSPVGVFGAFGAPAAASTDTTTDGTA